MALQLTMLGDLAGVHENFQHFKKFGSLASVSWLLQKGQSWITTKQICLVTVLSDYLKEVCWLGWFQVSESFKSFYLAPIYYHKYLGITYLMVDAKSLIVFFVFVGF